MDQHQVFIFPVALLVVLIRGLQAGTQIEAEEMQTAGQGRGATAMHAENKKRIGLCEHERPCRFWLN